MILDELGEFCDAISVAAGTGTTLIGDVIDLGAASRDIGTGEPIYLVINVDTSIITGGVAGTVQFILASDAQAAIATDGSATAHYTSQAFVTDDDALNDLDAGDTAVVVALPGGTYERYLGILCTVGTTTITAGKINAFLTKDAAKYQSYADAI